MKTKKEQAEMLETILDRCHDSRKGYEQAADSAKSDSMKLHFHNIAMERKDFSRDITSMVKGLGGNPSASGTFKGAAHRNWLNIKALLSSDTEETIIEECMTGDKRLIEDYMEVMREADLPKDYANILSRQVGNVQSRVNRLEVLEEKVS